EGNPMDPKLLRTVMGQFATGVTVITYLADGEPAGMTANAFMSVSLEPPLILFCADKRGRSWPRIRAAGRFCVNVLGEEQRDLCERFGSSRGTKFEGLEWDVSPWGAPTLPDVLLAVHAVVHDIHEAGDHEVVIGRVLQVERHDVRDGVWRRPMVFFRSRFGVGEPDAPIAPDPWGLGDRWGWG
ncbi:MAG TPA: flavin reductase family protein, partial [Rugosimonospora sp.]|nr:flavin reductase family protein [Rugosimonospora sp.]